jgi:hypothetical protein
MRTISHVNAELIAATATTGVASQPRINALRFLPSNCVGSHATSRHANVNEAAIIMPDRMDPSPESGHCGVWPLAESVNGAGPRSLKDFSLSSRLVPTIFASS